MTVPAFTLAMLLAGAPVNPGDTPPVIPVLSAASAASDQEVRDPAATVAEELPSPAPPAESLILKQPAAPASDPGLDGHEIVVTARPRSPPGDPLQGINIQSFELTQAVDRAVIRPVARAYQRILPDPVRSGFRNVLNNLREPVVFLNFLLQLKPGKAAETVGRFAINTTIGVAGLFDFAKRRPFNLPRRPNGFANTLGYYGVKPGPFLFLPLIGPTTLRDFLGDGLDRLVLPVAVGKPFNRFVYSVPIGVFSSLDQRAEFDEKLQALHEKSADPYANTREDYMKSRQAAIDALRGKKHRDADSPAPELADPPSPPPG